MRHYHKNKYVKKINLFSKDAVKSLDTSGVRYDTFTWNNIRDLGLYGDCKMKIGSLDFDTFVSEQVATADIQAPVPPDNLVVHYKFDGDLVDEIGDLGDITGNGTSFTTTSKKGDYALQLTNSSYATLPSFTFRDLAPEAFTIAFWFYAENLNNPPDNRWNRFFDFGGNDVNIAGARFPFLFARNTTDTDTVSITLFNTTTTSSVYKTAGTGNIFVGEWTHYCITMERGSLISGDRYNATWKIFVNGIEKTLVKIGTNNMEYPLLDTVRTNAFINKDNWNYTQNWNGKMDDFRIYDRALSSDEINRIMAEIQKDPVVHYKFENNLVDETGNTTLTKHIGTDALFSTSIVKRGTHSINIAANAIYKIQDKNFIAGFNELSLCSWVRSTNTNTFVILGKGNSLWVAIQSNMITVVIGAATWRFNFTYSNYTNIWFHFAVIVNLTNKTIQAFVNGVALTFFENQTITENTILNNESSIGLFGNITNNSTYYIGYIDDFRIYDKALDANEICEVMWADRGLYMWYKFEPVFNNFVASNDLVVHFKFDDDFTDAVGGSDLQIGTGMTTADFSDNFFKRGTHSFRFLDGGTDSGNAGRYGGLFTTPINWNTNTICFWSYQYANYELDKYYNTLWSFGNNEIYFALLSNTPGVVNFSMYIAGAPGVQTTNIVCSNANFKDKWFFWSFTFWKEGADVKTSIYLNCVLQQTLTFTNTSLPAITTDNTIGAGTGQRKGFGAYIDDFRIYNKVLTEDDIQNLYSKYLTFQDGMYNSIMTDEYSGFDISTIKKVGKYALDLSSGVKGGSITLTDGNINVFQNLQRLSICFWGFLSSKVDHQYHWVLYQENVMGVLIDTENMSCYVTIGLQVKFWDISDIIDLWKHYTVIIDYSETEPIKKMMLYIDGVDQGPGTMYGTNNTLSAFPEATKKLYIGSHDGSGIGFAGYIDDFRVYNFQVTPEDIASIMITEEKSYLFSVKCKEVYDTYESDYKTPTIYHNRGTFRNKHIINPYFKINRLHNSLTLNVNKYENSTFTPKGLETTDDFMITLLVEEDDKKELAEGNRIEYYHRFNQFKIKY